MRELDLLSLQPVDINATAAITETSKTTAAAMETRISALRAGIDETLARERASRDAELQALPIAERQQLRKLEDRLWNSRRRELTKAAQESAAADMEKHLQSLHNSKAKLQSLQALVGDSPAHMLTTLGTTGSERSATYMQTVERAQPGVLAQLARKAITSADLELGAAIAARLSAMEPKARPVSVQDLARALVGERHDKLSTSITEALDRVEDGLQAAGQWLVGRDATPLERVERGLRNQARARADQQALGRALRQQVRR